MDLDRVKEAIDHSGSQDTELLQEFYLDATLAMEDIAVLEERLMHLEAKLKSVSALVWGSGADNDACDTLAALRDVV